MTGPSIFARIDTSPAPCIPSRPSPDCAKCARRRWIQPTDGSIVTIDASSIARGRACPMFTNPSNVSAR